MQLHSVTKNDVKIGPISLDPLFILYNMNSYWILGIHILNLLIHLCDNVPSTLSDDTLVFELTWQVPCWMMKFQINFWRKKKRDLVHERWSCWVHFPDCTRIIGILTPSISLSLSLFPFFYLSFSIPLINPFLTFILSTLLKYISF